jgi:hypothetical protein
MSYYQPPPQVKRSGPRTTWIIIGVSVAVAVVLIAAVMLTEPRDHSGSGSRSAPATGAGQAQCDRDKREPCTVEAGQAFTIGRHETQAGWKVVSEYGRFGITAKVRNVSDRAGGAFMTFKFLRGDEVLGDVLCTSGQLEPRQVATLNCISDGEYSTSFQRITAEATF